MKTVKTFIFAALATPMLLCACSDSDSETISEVVTPAKQLMIYPATLIERNVSLDGTTTKREWSFSYNTDNKIEKYSYEETVEGNNVTITEKGSGKLYYFVNEQNADCIRNENTCTCEYYDSQDPTSTNKYAEYITEDAVLANNLIQTITVRTKHISLPDSTEAIWSGKYSYVYLNNYCDACTYQSTKNNKNTTTRYKYSWSGNNLIKAETDYQDDNNNVNNDTYTYSWNNSSYATEYTFNLTAFILGPTPKIYSAMGLFGNTSRNLLQKEQRTGYRIISNETHTKNAVTKNYSFFDNSSPSTVTITVASPSYREYTYTFK